METRANYALIGAFTLIVIASAFAFIFWFSGGTKQSDQKEYRVIFNGSVSGLNNGAQVSFNGLPVGEVKQIGFLAGMEPKGSWILTQVDPSRIEAVIRIGKNTPVDARTHAKLEFQGLTGIATLALNRGQAEPSAQAPPPDEVPIIYADRSDLQNLLESVQNLSNKANSVLDSANQLIADNRDSVHNILHNVEVFTDTLGTNKDNIDTVMKNSAELSAKLNESASKIDGLIASVQKFIGPDGAGDAVKTALADISAAAQSFRTLSDHLDQRTKDITAGVNRVTGPTAREYETLASDARRTLGELNKTLQAINQNPQQFLFGAKPNIPEYTPGR